jgi:hypothetical protein
MIIKTSIRGIYLETYRTSKNNYYIFNNHSVVGFVSIYTNYYEIQINRTKAHKIKSEIYSELHEIIKNIKFYEE